MKLSLKDLEKITSCIKNEEKRDEVTKILSNIEFKKKIKPEDILKKIKKFLNVEIRQLTEAELDNVFKDIPLSPCPIKDISEYNHKQIIHNLKLNLSNYKICIKNINKLKKYITDVFYSSVIDAGETVGVAAAMAIGELFTQLTLNTFHSAGQSQKGGDILETLNGLFNMSVNPNKNTDSSKIHFKNKNYNRVEMQQLIRKKILDITISLLLKDTYIIDEPVGPEDEWWYENNYILLKSKPDISAPFLRAHFDMYLCHIHGLTLYDIAEKIESKLKFKCIISPTDMGIIDIYVKKEIVDNRELFKLIQKSEHMKNKEETYGYILKQISSSYFDKITINGIKGIKDFDIQNEPLIQYIKYLQKESNIWIVYVDYYSIRLEGFPPQKFIDLFNSFEELEIIESNFNSRPYYMKLKCDKHPSKYINDKLEDINNDIQKNIEEKDNKNLFKNIHRLNLFYYNSATCYGKNIITSLLKHPNIDSRYVIPDNVHQITEYFGIETARLYIIRNYLKLINSGKNYVNPCNLELLVDFQTSLGKLLPVNSTGVFKQKGSTMSDASFDEPLKYFKKASAMGSYDKLNGISGSIIVGKQTKNGTGIVKVLYTNNIKKTENYEDTTEFTPKGKIFENNYEVQKFDSRGVSIEEEVTDISNIPNIFSSSYKEQIPIQLCPKRFIPKPVKYNCPIIFEDLENDKSYELFDNSILSTTGIIIRDKPVDTIGDSLL